MTKQEQFLWIAQSTVIANAINLSSRPDWAEKHRTDISEMGVFITMDEAVRASGLIPENLTAAQAANEFCTSGLRVPLERLGQTSTFLRVAKSGVLDTVRPSPDASVIF